MTGFGEIGFTVELWFFTYLFMYNGQIRMMLLSTVDSWQCLLGLFLLGSLDRLENLALTLRRVWLCSIWQP